METVFVNVQKMKMLCLVVLVGADGLGWPASTAAAPHKQAMTAAAQPAMPVETEVVALQQALQVLAVTAPSFDAQQGLAQRYERPSLREPFVKVGSPLPVWLGRKGLALRSDHDAAPLLVPGPRKREGDGRSPAGALRLLQMRGYAQEAPAGVTLPYRPSGPLDRCVDDPEAAAYTQVTQAPPEGPPPWRSAEELRLPTDHYKYLVVADYNMHLPQRGAGSCIFLTRRTSKRRTDGRMYGSGGSGLAGHFALALRRQKARDAAVTRARLESRPRAVEAPQRAAATVASIPQATDSTKAVAWGKKKTPEGVLHCDVLSPAARR
jgi:hypothetical protein